MIKDKNLRRQRDSTNASELDSLPAPPESLERFSSLSLTAIAEHLTELCARLKLPERKQESGRDIHIYIYVGKQSYNGGVPQHIYDNIC